jgi:type IV pilus assembly protein PilP
MMRARPWLASLALLLAACSGRDAALNEFIEQTKAEQGGRVEPLPEVKPFDTFAYNASMKRSPFVPGGSGVGSNSGIRPNVNRPREFLEQFSLDTMKFVGTLQVGGRHFGLLKVPDGRVAQVQVGNYVGQADGRIGTITDNKISLTEVVPDGLGGYIERPAAIGLSE